jgi:hypothetical protein
MERTAKALYDKINGEKEQYIGLLFLFENQYHCT